MKWLTITALAATLSLVIGCGTSDDVTLPPTGPSITDEQPEYGVFGHVYDYKGDPITVDLVEVTCTCGGEKTYWLSGPVNEDGEWATPFSPEEAEEHDGHNMRATSVCFGDYTDFTFYKPVTGPIDIVCLN